ncbi:ribonucleotide reductase N-terminal alpha domain-containing protein [Shouchella clausii]|uniref:ribonucleotide reductase N-terminal alpha domain-containing protein n=1 Tax=Shouchella clausii TaxID=79880 RepID=UPI001C730577|nr:hypothetical protein [Shouchella clausii]
MPSWIEANNEIMIRNENGAYQFEKDKEAAHRYFVDHINQNTFFFHDLKEKLKYLKENDYYEKELLKWYSFDEIKSVFNAAYAHKFRFPSFMSASKFYNDYSLKTNDGTKILERYEDRVAVVSLFFGLIREEDEEGNIKIVGADANKAVDYVDLMMRQEFQPATPTFLNAGRKRRGELVSCFLLEVGDSLNDISRAIETSMQLSKVGGGVSLNLSKIRAKGESIKGVENVTKGVVGVMKMLDNAFRYADQMGQRQGSGAAYLNIFHADINEFLDSKKISADEDVRVKTLSIGVVIPDKFIELAKEDRTAYVFYPHTVYKAYGTHLDEMDMTEMYDKLVDNPAVRKDPIKPRQLLQKLAVLRSESGYPYIMFADNVKKAHPNSGKVKFSNLCVTGDTMLLTDKGYEKAETLWETGEELRVVIDNRTKNFNLDEKGTSVVDAIPMHLTKQNADIFEVETKQGFKIKATEWHKFYVKRDSKIVKIPLNELEKGDKLLVQSGEGKYGTNNDPALAYLMGIIAGDGTFTDKAVKIYLYDNKKSLAPTIERLVAEVIKKYSPDREYKHNTSFEPKFTNVDNKFQSLMTLNSTVLGEILESFGFNRNNKTEVPQIIYESDKVTQAAYLSGYYQMDGTVNANFAAKALTIELVSVNKRALRGIQQLLLNMGIYSTIYSNKARGKCELPDGKGGSKLYDVKQTHKLSVQDRHSRELFYENIELKEYDKRKFEMLTATLQKKSRKPKHGHTAEVVSIEYIGKEDVFDTTQPDHSSLIFNGIVTGNCSEILQESEVSEYTDYGEPDSIGMDISCNLGSLNIANVMRYGNIERAVKLAMDALTAVSQATDIKNAPAVRKANRRMRSVGLGAMNLHGYLASVGIPYESEEARDFANVFFATVNYWSLVRSMELAKETGSKYEGFEKSTYANGEYFRKYTKGVHDTTEPDWFPKTEKVRELFNGIWLPDKIDWMHLLCDVREYGLYHSYRLAIAPTGSISYVQSATASVMPIMERIEERTYGNSKTYYPMPGLNANNWFFYKEAYDMDMFKVVDMIATIQQHVDQGISFTLFLKDTMTTRDLNRIDLYAHHKGIKTLYYARTKDTGQEGCLSCVV